VLGTSRLLTFAFRALIILLIIAILWVSVAESYNQALVALAGPLLPGDTTVHELGVYLVFEHSSFNTGVSIDGLTLHFGLVLVSVLVLAAVGISIGPRIGWLAAFVIGAFFVHVAGVAMLGRGLVWAAGADSPAESTRFVLSLFAVFWGLIPPAAGGVWCFAYWLPKLRNATETQNVTPST
jgi:hypothetical protein